MTEDETEAFCNGYMTKVGPLLKQAAGLPRLMGQGAAKAGKAGMRFGGLDDLIKNKAIRYGAPTAVGTTSGVMDYIGDPENRKSVQKSMAKGLLEGAIASPDTYKHLAKVKKTKGLGAAAVQGGTGLLAKLFAPDIVESTSGILSEHRGVQENIKKQTALKEGQPGLAEQIHEMNILGRDTVQQFAESMDKITKAMENPQISMQVPDDIKQIMQSMSPAEIAKDPNVAKMLQDAAGAIKMPEQIGIEAPEDMPEIKTDIGRQLGEVGAGLGKGKDALMNWISKNKKNIGYGAAGLGGMYAVKKIMDWRAEQAKKKKVQEYIAQGMPPQQAMAMAEAEA